MLCDARHETAVGCMLRVWTSEAASASVLVGVWAGRPLVGDGLLFRTGELKVLKRKPLRNGWPARNVPKLLFLGGIGMLDSALAAWLAARC